MRRVICRNWIVDLGRDPATSFYGNRTGEAGPDPELEQGVHRALARLPQDEEEFIRLFYFQGFETTVIAAYLNRTLSRVETLRRKAMRRLRLYLCDELRGKFGTSPPVDEDCPICVHPRRRQIEKLLARKKPDETWRKTIGLLRDNFNLTGISPRRLAGHMSYHYLEGGEVDGSD
jgi:hypothetical protein